MRFGEWYRRDMSSSESPRVASVTDLNHTPVTLGVVLIVQAVAIGAVLLVAGVIWGRISTLENKLDAMQNDVSQIREDTRETRVLLRALSKP